MEVEQQGLYLLTIVCSLVSLLACCFVLLTSAVTGMWKSSSVRLMMYLTAGNILTGITLLLPTYKYDFLCSVQVHILHFCLVSQAVLTTLLMHFCYMKTVLEQAFTVKTETLYLLITILPSFLVSIPPFISENVGNNCWNNNCSPLQDAVASIGYLLIYLVGVLFSFSFYMGTMVNLSLFPKGYFTEEFNSKLEKMRMTGKFTIIYIGIGMILFIYGTLELIDRHRRGIDFIAMFFQASCGTFTLILFLSSHKVQKGMKKFFKDRTSVKDVSIDEDPSLIEESHYSIR